MPTPNKRDWLPEAAILAPRQPSWVSGGFFRPLVFLKRHFPEKAYSLRHSHKQLCQPSSSSLLPFSHAHGSPNLLFPLGKYKHI